MKKLTDYAKEIPLCDIDNNINSLNGFDFSMGINNYHCDNFIIKKTRDSVQLELIGNANSSDFHLIMSDIPNTNFSLNDFIDALKENEVLARFTFNFLDFQLTKTYDKGYHMFNKHVFTDNGAIIDNCAYSFLKKELIVSEDTEKLSNHINYGFQDLLKDTKKEIEILSNNHKEILFGGTYMLTVQCSYSKRFKYYYSYNETKFFKKHLHNNIESSLTIDFSLEEREIIHQFIVQELKEKLIVDNEWIPNINSIEASKLMEQIYYKHYKTFFQNKAIIE